jgi:hypothetical protein
MTKTTQKRFEKLLPSGQPKYIRVYDNDGLKQTRYTVVFTGNYRKRSDGEFWSIHMSKNPQEYGFVHEYENGVMIDRPTSAHIGHPIKFTDMPRKCQDMTIRYYVDLWDLPIPEGI